MQKGFWPDVDGVTEHLELLQYLIKHQKRNKRDIYIILMYMSLKNLKNAFGEVHHSLIRFALREHHVPNETIELIMSQYNHFYLNVAAQSVGLLTGPIHVQRDVLLGDTLSPLLFNLVFDSLMSTLTDPQIQSHGVLWGDGYTRSLWTQFSDDAAVVSDNYKESQLILHGLIYRLGLTNPSPTRHPRGMESTSRSSQTSELVVAPSQLFQWVNH